MKTEHKHIFYSLIGGSNGVFDQTILVVLTPGQKTTRNMHTGEYTHEALDRYFIPSPDISVEDLLDV